MLNEVNILNLDDFKALRDKLAEREKNIKQNATVDKKFSIKDTNVSEISHKLVSGYKKVVEISKKIISDFRKIDFRNIDIKKIDPRRIPWGAIISSIKDGSFRGKLIGALQRIGFKSWKSKNSIIAYVIVLLLTIVGIAGFVQSEQSKMSIAQNTAEKYYYKGDFETAIAEYEKLYKKNTTSPWWKIKIAEIYSVKGEFNTSKSYLEAVKLTNPKQADVLNYIVFTELMNKDYSLALKDGEDALKLYPEDKQLIKTMFTVYMFNSQSDAAKALILSYPVDNTSAYDLAEYARMLITVNEWDMGFKNLKAAFDISKEEYKIYDVLAQISSFDLDNVLEKISALAEKNPKDICYKMWLAKVYSTSATTADSANNILQEFDRNKNDVGTIEIKLIKAAVLQNLNKSDDADALIAEVIKDNPHNYSILHTAAWYYLNKGKTEQALKYCTQSILENKEYPDNYSYLMPKILEQEGKIKESEPYLRTALSKEPYNYNILLNIANLYLNSVKDNTKALEYYSFAEKIRPKDAEIKYSMALVYLKEKDKVNAVKKLQECIKINARIPKYHRTLGAIYLVQGKNSDGIKQTRLAYSLDERDILTLNNAGVYYITVTLDLNRALQNFQAAYEGIDSKSDKYIKDTITSNYKKVKALIDKYNKGKGKEKLTIPPVTLFY